MLFRRAVSLLFGALVPGLMSVMLCAQALPHDSTPETESLLISRGDLLEITVFDVPEMERHIRVSDAGDVRLPLVHEIQVAGLTTAAASMRIGEALQRGGFVRDPEVTIAVLEFATEDVSISGEVVHPGNFPLRTPRDLMNVLTLAGGMTISADVHVTVRRKGAGGETLYATLPNDPHDARFHSVMVEPGDTVIVPRAGIVYVMGDVGRPGGYVMQNDATLTALQAVAMASGTTKTSAESHVRLVRQSPGGPVEVQLDLRAMQKGKLPDSALQAQDVLYVPYSTARNMMLGASAILSSTGGAAIYAVR